MLISDVGALIVEDVSSVRVQIREILRTAGFKRIYIASNSAEARRVIEIEAIQLVLLDWHMEPESGFDLLKFIRNHPLKAATPVIMVTGENTKERIMEVVQLGVDGYILKPMTIGQVQGQVFQALMKKKVIG